MTPQSLVTINGVPLDIDPDAYTPIEGRRRGSVHKLVGGGTLVQDFGINEGDMTVQFSGMTINTATRQALYALYRKTGAVYRFTDFYDNDFQVRFEPGEQSLQMEMVKGSASGWKYTIKLRVISVTKQLGIPLAAQS